MKNYFVILFVINLIFSCSKKPTEPVNANFDGDSYPVGPLRISNSKVKTETRYRLYTSDILEKTDYEYYNNGLLKRKTRTLSDMTIYTINNYYYDNSSNLIKEIVLEGSLYSDTILYRYNSSNKLLQKETSHSSPDFVLRDTVFYKYDVGGNLIEWTKRDPYNEYKIINSEKSEYSNGLLTKKYSYVDDNLIRTFEYKYYNDIMTQRLVYMSSGLLEHKLVYYYDDGLLKNVKGYFADEKNYSEQIIYEYNNRYELIIQKVYEPSYSSYVDHEIHYEYY